MTVADNLRALVSELRPLIDERLDIDERISEIRGPASDKGLDFSQAKSLVIALARDSRDGGERVAKLTAKADNASWYADMLKSPTMAETSNNSPQSPADKAPAKEATKHQSPGSDKAPNQRPNRQGETAAQAPSSMVDEVSATASGVDPGELLDPIKLVTESVASQSPRSQSDGAAISIPAPPSGTAASNSEIEGAAPAGPHLNGRIESDRKTDFSAPSSLPDDGDVRDSPFDRNRVEA